MIDLFRLAAHLQDFFTAEKWRFCFIGGIALQRWGEPRLTRDVDICLLTGFGNEEHFIDTLLSRYQSRIDNAREFALTRRVVLLKAQSGIGIYISLGGLPFEESVVRRASTFEFLSDAELLTCSAEDLIVLKAFADRTRDWLDVETIIVRQNKRLDWPFIHSQLTPLCEIKEAPHIIEKLSLLREEQERQ